MHSCACDGITSSLFLSSMWNYAKLFFIYIRDPFLFSFLPVTGKRYALKLIGKWKFAQALLEKWWYVASFHVRRFGVRTKAPALYN